MQGHTLLVAAAAGYSQAAGVLCWTPPPPAAGPQPLLGLLLLLLSVHRDVLPASGGCYPSLMLLLPVLQGTAPPAFGCQQKAQPLLLLLVVLVAEVLTAPARHHPAAAMHTPPVPAHPHSLLLPASTIVWRMAQHPKPAHAGCGVGQRWPAEVKLGALVAEAPAGVGQQRLAAGQAVTSTYMAAVAG